MCLWGIFQSGGSEDVVQLWKTGGPCAPGGAESRRMATLGQPFLQGGVMEEGYGCVTSAIS